MPSVKKTYQSAQRLAARRGYIKTILGRRRRFTGDDPGVHKSLNACLQGSAADIIKRAMVECHRTGVFDEIGFPHLTVHDELDWSRAPGKAQDEGFAEAQRIMEQCVPLKVPLRVSMSQGSTWGDCE
jgi:DNA polymerase-1